MKTSELIANLQEFITINGDIEISSEYWCEDCDDTHEGNGYELELTYDGKLKLSVSRY